LSRERAQAVVAAIGEQLPDAVGRLSTHGVGPLSPVATNDNGEGRALNRRVELVSRVAD
jgi:outer membrane protein OmpA-like peptidoglycan-associated protein